MTATLNGPFTKKLNEGLWIVKCLIMIVLFGICLLIPPGFFYVVIEISKFLAVLISLMIIVAVIDVFYCWAEAWQALYLGKEAHENNGVEI